MKKKIMYGTNKEGYLCVWDGNGVMHYFSATTERTQSELNQAKTFVLLLKIAKKLKISVNL